MISQKQIIYVDATPVLSERLSGIGHLTLQTIRYLSKKETEFEVRLLVPFRKVHYIKHWGLSNKIIRIPLPARVWNRLPLIRLTPPIDIFLENGTYIFPNFKAWPLLKSKSITYIHDISFELFPQFTEERNLKALKLGVPRWINNSNIVVTDSYNSKNEIVEHYNVSKNKMEVVYCGVDGDIFKPISENGIDAITKKYGLTTKYFMFLSNLEPRKNIERLLDAIDKLPSDMKKEYALLLVGGMGWRNEDIYRKIETLRAHGWSIIKPNTYVPDGDIPALLSGATALLHPTLHEGFGIPAIEAMSCGTPVITSDIAVMREVCKDAAIFVDPLDTKRIAKAIEDLSCDEILRKTMKQRGILRAKQFTWESASDELGKVIYRVNKGIID